MPTTKKKKTKMKMIIHIIISRTKNSVVIQTRISLLIPIDFYDVRKQKLGFYAAQ